MLVDLQQNPFLGIPANDEVIPGPYQMESQWSIPSIRLANHVNQSSALGGLQGSIGDFSQYTDEGSLGDESFYSFLADDDDTASLSSRGSLDNSRRRRISMVKLQHFQRMDSAQQAQEEAANSGWGDVVPPTPPPAIVQTNSFLERMYRISIEGEAGASAGDTMDSTNGEVKNADVAVPSIIPPPLPRRANDDSIAPNVAAVDAVPRDEDQRPSRSRRRRHRSGRRKEGKATQWLQDLQSQNNVQLIAESASSKFMTVGAHEGKGFGAAFGAGGTGVRGVGGGAVPGQLSASSDVTKALGMPHPLCRSSTIEAGPFTVHRGVGPFGVSSGTREGVSHLGSGNNSIALTSSGSGD